MPVALHAAGVVVVGTVQSAQGSGIEDASVQLLGTRFGTTTGPEGRFELDLPETGKAQLRVSHLGYEEVILELDSGEDQRVIDVGIVQLQARSERLKTVLYHEPRSRIAIGESAASASVIGEREFTLEQPQSTAEVLRETPGVMIQKTSHGGGHAIMRGMTSNRVLLLVDGVRLNNSTYRLGNHPYLTFVDPLSVEIIEVFRGPSSVLHGSDALGGAINLLTRTAPFSDSLRVLSAALTGRSRSADDELLGHGELALSSRTWSLQLAGGYDATGDLSRGEEGDPVMNPDPPVVQHPTGFDVSNMLGTLRWRPVSGALVTLSHQRTERPEVPRYDKLVDGDQFRWSYVDQRRELTYLQLDRELDLGGIHWIHLNLSLQRQSEGRSKQGAPNEDRTDEYDETMTKGLTLSGEWRVGEWSGLFGLDGYFDEVKSQSIDITPRGVEVANPRGRYPDGATYNSLGLFAEQEVWLTSRLRAEVGARASRFTTNLPTPGGLPFAEVDLDFGALTGSVGLLYDLTPHTATYLRIAQGFRAPNVADLSKLGESKGSTFEVPNTDLKPEDLLSFEWGVRGDGDRVSGEAILYYSRIENTITSVPSTWQGSDEIVISGDTMSVRTKSNRGLGIIYGAEWGGGINFGRGFVLRSSVTWAWGVNETQDEPFDGIQPLTGYLGLRWAGPAGGAMFEPYLRFARKQDRLSPDDLEDSRIPAGGTPGWWTLNLRYSMELGNHGTVALAFENLFDLNYRVHASGLNAPGRQIVATLQLKTGDLLIGR